MKIVGWFSVLYNITYHQHPVSLFIRVRDDHGIRFNDGRRRVSRPPSWRATTIVGAGIGYWRSREAVIRLTGCVVVHAKRSVVIVIVVIVVVVVVNEISLLRTDARPEVRRRRPFPWRIITFHRRGRTVLDVKTRLPKRLLAHSFRVYHYTQLLRCRTYEKKHTACTCKRAAVYNNTIRLSTAHSNNNNNNSILLSKLSKDPRIVSAATLTCVAFDTFFAVYHNII